MKYVYPCNIVPAMKKRVKDYIVTFPGCKSGPITGAKTYKESPTLWPRMRSW